MVQHVIIAGALLISASSAFAGLDLNPSVSEYEGDGARFQQLVFKCDGRQASYRPPTGWECSGSATRLNLRPKNAFQAEAFIAVAPTQKPQPLDEPSLKKLATEMAASKGTTATVLTCEASPFKIEGRDTALIAIKYDRAGGNFVHSTIFLNRESEQVRFELDCREKDYKDAQKAFQGSLFSWQGI